MPAPTRKTKRPAPQNKSAKRARVPDVVSDEGSSDDALDAAHEEDSDEELIQQTADEKRLQLAKQYLQKIDAQVGRAEDDSDDDDAHETVADRLKKEAAEANARFQKKIAVEVAERWRGSDDVRVLRGHSLSTTCATLCDEDKIAYTGSKDGSILRWDVETGKKTRVYPKDKKFGPQILCLASSTDGNLVASSGQDKLITVYDTRANKVVETFKGHRDIVTALAFRRNSHQLFTGSHDRTVKVWNLDEMCYVDTLFGHQSEVVAIDSLNRERCLTSGVDRTVRQWKIVEETQLVFRGHMASIDCVSMINEEMFVSGGADGSVSFWHNMKKKPVAVLPAAHGAGSAPNWITSIASQKFTDLVATGSCDGHVRFHQCSDEGREIRPLFEAEVTGGRAHVYSPTVDEVLTLWRQDGFVNALCFAESGKFCLAGVGQEHRLGRWQRIPAGRNGIAIIPL